MRLRPRLPMLATLALAMVLPVGLGAAPALAADSPSPAPADSAAPAPAAGSPAATAPAAPAQPAPTVPFVPITAAPPAPVPEGCADPLVATLAGAGFTGEDLREAWAIAMRESRGIATIGPGDPRFNGRDFGLFQFNQPTWGTQAWWDPALMVTPQYNAAVAYALSAGGTTWLPWGLDGTGRPSPRLYRDFGWTRKQVKAWIVRPYRQNYRAYPCSPPPAATVPQG